MVNQEMTSPKTRQALSRTLARWLGELVTAIGQRLENEGQLESLFRLNLSENEDPSLRRTLRAVENTLASTLVTDAARVFGATAVASELSQARDQLGLFLKGRARRHINAVAGYPSVATRSTEILRHLEATSVQTSPFSSVFSEPLASLEDLARATVAGLLERRSIKSLAELASFLGDDLEMQLMRIEHLLVGEARTVHGAATSAVEATLELLRINAGTMNRPVSRRDLLKRLELADAATWNDLLLRSEREIEQAQTSLQQGESIETILSLDTATNHLRSVLTRLESTDMHCSCDTANNIDAENLLYIDALTRALIISGEIPCEAEKLADHLMDDCLRQNIKAIDLIDEEIIKLSPTIKRDSLAKIRLDLRLSETRFPLSVAHRDWILKTLQTCSPADTKPKAE